MGAITVKAPQGFPIGTALDVYDEPGGDVSVKGKRKNGAGTTVAADGSVTFSGLNAGQHYQVGGIDGTGAFRSFLAPAR